MADLVCPECEADVPATGISSAIGMGPTGKITMQPNREHTTCKSCGARLVRNQEPPVDEWRLDTRDNA